MKIPYNIGKETLTNYITRNGSLLKFIDHPFISTTSQINDEKYKSNFERRSIHTAKQSSCITLYQYNNCPFCCKVRAYLKFRKFTFEITEVNPLTRSEISFSKYKKVPIIVVDGKQINDSTVIVSLLESYLNTGTNLDVLFHKYSAIHSEQGKLMDYENKYKIYGRDAQISAESQKEEHWRRWVSTYFIHRLAPNIYRSIPEAYEAMDYISNHGNFSPIQRFLAKNGGALFMFAISDNLRKKHKMGHDVRQELFNGANEWMTSLGSHNFNGGSSPNLADVEMYGVLNAIEGLSAFKDLTSQVPDIQSWHRLIATHIC